jgi:hypothetical protein
MSNLPCSSPVTGEMGLVTIGPAEPTDTPGRNLASPEFKAHLAALPRPLTRTEVAAKYAVPASPLPKTSPPVPRKECHIMTPSDCAEIMGLQVGLNSVVTGFDGWLPKALKRQYQKTETKVLCRWKNFSEQALYGFLCDAVMRPREYLCVRNKCSHDVVGVFEYRRSILDPDFVHLQEVFVRCADRTKARYQNAHRDLYFYVVKHAQKIRADVMFGIDSDCDLDIEFVGDSFFICRPVTIMTTVPQTRWN